ncbi:MAG TPA: EAL domain-containing protein [Solirubrobacteraceae bacterium]|jgi:diguanylate cyclase (GGDEF)-like protein
MSSLQSGHAPTTGVHLQAQFIDAVSRVHALVSEQAAPKLTYQAVLDGALRLMGGESGALRLVDEDDPGWMVAVALHAGVDSADRSRRRAPITEGMSGRVISTGKPVALENQAALDTGSRLAPPGTRAGMGVPISVRGEVIGALVIGTSVDRRWTEHDRRTMSAYGEHVEVALAVARAHHGALGAITDPLTGLGNRTLLLERLEHRLARADREGTDATVLFLDLDRFKLVNDSLGHLVGDQLLCAVADRLRGCLREGDVCARLGGDEFAVLLDGRSDAEAVSERIVGAMEPGFEVDGHEVFVGVSVGIASGRQPAETLLRNADVAMYEAKRAGTARYARFEPQMHAALVSRLGLDAELRRAVERQEFELHYQPLTHLRTDTVTAFESLVRWRHPLRGLVGPVEFVPVAEETGLIVEIDRWVRFEACHQLAEWWRMSPLGVSFNASMRDLQHPGFAASLEEAIAGAFPPSALILEVTESAALQDAPGALAALHEVKELGVRIALDDFGTGYSSLLSLAQLPIDILKIARPFLQASGPGTAKATGLLAGMIGLGRHLGLLTVAEGIETQEQRDLLEAAGCDVGQGFLLGRPADAAATTRLLTTRR